LSHDKVDAHVQSVVSYDNRRRFDNLRFFFFFLSGFLCFFVLVRRFFVRF
jgi:hypothetical protein